MIGHRRSRTSRTRSALDGRKQLARRFNADINQNLKEADKNLTTNTQLTTNEGFAINVAGLSKSFMIGDTYSGAANGSTVQTVADMISYINADTTWDSASIDITVSNI